ncbi:SLC5/6 family protein [Paraburkholderia saeva]|uniref:Uncharacterized protein n=1 Tax=Paraburkholderia saeva TaxID=2777537 RepID=A0A9N8RV94_9BURK|nr:hypothetical protein [Paraburkholderia saeva]CAG4896682.1 hypothetical protein LMG31841_02345 [Paraburkholderia saeva]
MANRNLSVWQVASLLISTSCGIGFLMGTGELALRQGMAACLYAVASAIGLLALGLIAPQLWATGQSIWTRFDLRYGSTVSRQVAFLSLIWMTGVLSAQIRGASSVLAMSGVPHAISIFVVDCLVVGLSFLRLSWLSGVLALCIGGCNVILAYTLIKAHGLAIWLHAPANFLESMRLPSLDHSGMTFLSVVALVICGADYQQFLIASSTPIGARLGCLLAAVVVFAMGFLPASAVIANAELWHLRAVADPVQIIPHMLTLVLGHANGSSLAFAIAALITAALGSACSIVRATSDAMVALWHRQQYPSALNRVLSVCAATLVTARGQSIIDTMVMLNVVYLASVGPLLGLTLLGRHVTAHAARRSMMTGFTIAMACYLVLWIHAGHLPESMPLILAWPCAFVEALRSKAPTGIDDSASAPLNQSSSG